MPHLGVESILVELWGPYGASDCIWGSCMHSMHASLLSHLIGSKEKNICHSFAPWFLSLQAERNKCLLFIIYFVKSAAQVY